jgi:hypothetical protein
MKKPRLPEHVGTQHSDPASVLSRERGSVSYVEKRGNPPRPSTGLFPDAHKKAGSAGFFVIPTLLSMRM